MKTVSLLFLSLLVLLTCSGRVQAESWVEDSYDDFADGRLDASGQNLYVSRQGTVSTIHRFDLNQDGYIDLIFNSTHDSFAFVPASVAAVSSDRKLQPGELAVEGSQQVQIADLNRDGYVDLVFCPNSSGIQHPRRFLTILWGGEDGWPSHRSNGALPTRGATSLAITDLDHDDWPDIAVLCDEAWMIGQPSGRIVRIFWGGERGFLLKRQRDFGVANAVDLTSGDFDGDGAADLVVLTSAGKLQVFWATASLSKSVPLQTSEVVLPDNGSRCITSADVDGDQIIDLVVGTNDSVASIVPGKPGRSWGKVETLSAYRASHISVGDLDADGQVDLVLTDFAITRALGGEAGAAGDNDTSIRIMWGGDGFHASRSTRIDVPFAAATAVGDLDEDHRPDLAIAVHQGTETYATDSVILFGKGNRQFEKGKQGILTQGATDVAIVQAHHGLPPRVVFANAQGGTLNEQVPLLLYWGGLQGFDPDRVWKVPVDSGYEASAADLNADGFVDLIAMNSGHAGELAQSNPHLGANIFWGSRDGFDDMNRETLREYGLGVSNVADLNRDGYLDLVLGAFEHDGDDPEVLVIYYGSPSGLSRDRRVALPCARRSTGCIVADYNRDDWLDIAVSSYPDNSVRVFWGSSAGFAADRLFELDVPSPIGLESADLNADGHLDLIAGSYYDEIEKHHDTGTFIFWGGATGFQHWNAQWLPGMTPVGYVVADFDADGFLDLFSPHYHSELTREALPCYLYWGSADGFTPRGRTILICDSAHDGVAADFDRDGRLDLAVSCHTRDGDHHTNSRIFYNDGKRFANPRTEFLPTHGTHWMYVQDMGHIYHRRWEQKYESSVYQWDKAVSVGQVDYKADVPQGTELRIDVRTAASKGQLNQAEWQHLEANAFSLHATDRCLQYRATFKSDNGDRFPVLDRVTVDLSTGQ